MKKFLQNNLYLGLGLGLSALILTFIKGFLLIAAIIGFFGYKKSRLAIKEGKLMGVLGVILNVFPILYLLLTLFVLGYTLSKR